MKILAIVIGFIFTHQVLRAQNILTSGKQVVVRYHGACTKLENDSIRKTKLYNLHIVRNFPMLYCDVKTLLAMDDSALFDLNEKEHTTPSGLYEKSPLKNIKWNPTKTPRKIDPITTPKKY